MKIWQKTIATVATFALLFNSLAAPLTVLAQTEPTETPSPTPEATTEATPTPEAIVEPTATPEETATPEATPAEIVTPTPEETPAATDLVTPAPTDVPAETQAPESNPTVQGPPASVEPSAEPSLVPTFSPVPQIENATVTTTVVTTSVFPETVQNDLFKLITDKLDYSPTELAIITGSNFTPNKIYSLTIASTDDPATSTTVEKTTDENGSFTYEYQLDGNYRPNYSVEVKDGEQIVATTTFRDNKNLTINFAGTGGGSVSFSNLYPYVSISSCTSTASPCIRAVDNYQWGTMTVSANAGSTFSGWSGSFTGTGTTNCTGTTSPCNFYLSGSAQSLTATFNVPNTAPTNLSLSPASVAENQIVNTVVGNFTTTDANAGDTFTYTLVVGTGSTDNGSFNILNSNLQTSAVFDFENKNSYTIRVRTTDTGGLFYEKQFTIGITNVNEAPIAIAHGYTTNEDTALTVSIPGVLSGDTDPDSGSSLTAVKASDPTHGTVTLNANGSFVYTPALNYYGLDSFTYKASDGALNSAAATVSITVNPVNDPPVAVNDNVTTSYNTPITIDVLANDTDPDPDFITINAVGYPSYGSASLDSVNWKVIYTPPTNFVGTDTFIYRIRDGYVNSGWATVTITVNPPAYTPTRICHATGSNSNPYNEITPNTSGQLSGHVGSSHQDGKDIIPPIPYYLPDGQNWDTTGQATWNNGCVPKGSIKVCKVIVDAQGNITNGSAMPATSFRVNWTGGLGLAPTIINSGYTPNTKIFSTSQGNDAYCVDYPDIPLDNYGYSAEIISNSTGWETPKYNDQFNSVVLDLGDFKNYQTPGDENSNGYMDLTNQAGPNRTLVILNQYKVGSVTVTKFNDANQDGELTEGESVLNGWTINLGDKSIVTGIEGQEEGKVMFTNVLPGRYNLSEDPQDGWIQTNIFCTGEGTYNDRQVVVSPGANVQCYIGNFQTNPKVLMAKTNDKSSGIGQSDTITYTLSLENTGNVELENVNVYDVPPAGFTYVVGTTTINGAVASDPSISSGTLTWNVSSLAAGATVKIVYQLKTPGDLSDGTYTNFAVCKGGQAIFEKVLVRGVEADCDPAGVTSTVTKGQTTNFGGNLNTVGQVLGASTELPGTGSPTVLLIIALGALGAGLFIRGYNIKITKKAKKGKKYAKK